MIPSARPRVGWREKRAVIRVLKSGNLAQGPEVEQFEQEFSTQLVSGRPVVAVNSGTSGQHLGLLAAGIGVGDEVIVPSFTFAATANAVALTGATPVFCDINLETFCLDPQKVSELISDRTKGIMPVHLFGHPADMTDLLQLSSPLGLSIFEDAAQAHGARIGERFVGTFGTFGMFSLYPTKNMTSGEGGMVSFENEELARFVRIARNQGMEKRYENEAIGYNNRMSDIHAAIGRVQLRKLSRLTERRRRNARFFDLHLRGVAKPIEKPGYKHVYHQYTIRVSDDREGFAGALFREHGVQTGHFYPIPLHKLKPFEGSRRAESLEISEKVAKEVLSLPVHPSLRQRDLERIVWAVNRVSRAGG